MSFYAAIPKCHAHELLKNAKLSVRDQSATNNQCQDVTASSSGL